MNIMITGGAGFIGHHLARFIRREKPRDKLIIVDDLSSGKKEFLRNIGGKLKFYRLDIANPKRLGECFAKEKPDVVIHLAAVHFVPECNRNPFRTMMVNVIGTHNVVALTNRHKTKQFIFASSAAVYGPSRRARNENMVPNPRDIYGCSKLCGEQIVKNMCSAKWSILRIFNTIGPEETNPHLVASVISQLSTSTVVKLGNLHTKRDYVFVDDLVEGIYKALNNKRAYSQIFNFGSGKSISPLELVLKLETIVKKKIKIAQCGALKRKTDDVFLLASIKKSKKILSWQPKHSLGCALQKIISTQKQQTIDARSIGC